jgi:hypothetical protein
VTSRNRLAEIVLLATKLGYNVHLSISSIEQKVNLMAQLVCEISPGLRDSEKTVAVRDVFGRAQFLRVESGFLAATADRWYLPVGIVGIDHAQKLALVELPHEADSGVNRLWVRLSELREMNGAVA